MANKENGTGYGHPPKATRFKPGKSGNLKGRPRKKAISISNASILDDIMAEEIEIGGRKMTKRVAYIRGMFASACKGQGMAIRTIEKMMAEPVRDEKPSGGGVLVVPGTMPLDEWSAAAAIQQAKFRDANHGDVKIATDEEDEEKKKYDQVLMLF